jgi:hypothetical protein
MKTGLKLLLAFVIALGAAFPVMAGTILLTPDTVACGQSVCLAASGMDTSQAAINAKIALINPSLVNLYTATQPQSDPPTLYSETGPFAGSYETSFAVPGLLTASARISYVDGSSAISSGPVYALIKDGVLGWYLFDITSWDGISDIDFSGFYDNQGRISHVSIYGLAQVPDGGLTVMLLGLGVGSLALFSRKFRQ